MPSKDERGEIMKSELLYYSDQYLKEVTAKVIATTARGIVLDRTIFYPEGGGQRGDSGYYGSYRIVGTIKEGETVVHLIDGDKPKVGSNELLRLDWPERFFSMVEHTSQHLISSILYNSFQIATLAVHQGEDYITIETDKSTIDLSTLLKVEDEAIEHICQNKRVWQVEMKREDALALNMRRSIKVDSELVKVVFIDNTDCVCCGGVHISHLGEIGEISYIASEEIRGRVRTIWACGKKARERRRENQELLLEAKRMLSATDETLLENIGRLIRENTEIKRRVDVMSKAEAEREFREKIGSSQIGAYMTDYALDSLVEIACQVNKKVFILNKEKNNFLLVGSKDDFASLKDKIELKGGGREPLFRGTILGPIEGLIDRVDTILKEHF